MTHIPAGLAEEEMFVALCEGLRWWFAFDGPQTALIARQDGRMTGDDVRRIAIQYNFMRNLPSNPALLTQIGAKMHSLANTEASTLDERAGEVETIVEELFKLCGTRFRLASGTTKLLWFMSPPRWTPYDRLAAKAVCARFSGVRRMRDYYRRLDQIGFLQASSEIDQLLSGTVFDRVGGNRILDKLLMMGGEPEWTLNVRPIAIAFAEALPVTLQSTLVDTAERMIANPSCQLDFGAL